MLLHSKENYQQNKNMTHGVQKIFASDTLDKDFISNKYKEYTNNSL